MLALGVGLSASAVLGRRAFDPASLGGLVARYEAGLGLFEDAGGATPAAAGSPVGRWADQSGNGHNLVQGAGANRPVAKLVGGQASVHFGGAHWLDIPAGLQLDRRGSTILAVLRSRAAETQTLWHMPAAPPAHTFYLHGGTAAGELRFFNEASRAGLIQSSHGTVVMTAVNRASELRLQLGGEITAGLPASNAGSVSGGWVGQWNGGGFRLKGHVHELLVYGRALADAEIAQVADHLAAKHRALMRSEDRYLAFEGDGITQGVGASNAEDFCFPAQLVRRLARQPKWSNLGAAADTIQNMAATTSVLTAQLARNQHYGRRLAVLLAGGSDIKSGRSAAQVSADVDAWIAAVRTADAGLVPIGCTILPRTDFATGEESVRQAVNQHIRTAANFAFTVDLAADSRLAEAGNAALYGDGVHPTDAGHGVIAELVHGALAARGYD